jgi:hypothetical protein
MKRAIQQEIENPLSKLILQGKFAVKDFVKVDAVNGELVFTKGGCAEVFKHGEHGGHGYIVPTVLRLKIGRCI